MQNRTLYTAYILFLITFTIGAPYRLCSQGQQDTVGLPSDRLIVNKKIQIEANEVETKIFDLVSIPSKSISLNLPIDFKDFTFDYELPTPKLRPIRYNKEETSKPKDGWLRLGGGMPNIYLADLGYDYSIMDWFGFGANLFFNQGNYKFFKVFEI